MTPAGWKRVVVLLLVLIVAAIVLSLVSSPILTFFSGRMLDRLVERRGDSLIRIEAVRIGRVVLDPRVGLVCRGIRGQARLSSESGFRAERQVAFEIDRVEIRPDGLIPFRLALDVDGLSAVATLIGEVSGERLAAAELLTYGRGRFILAGAAEPPVEWVRKALGDVLRGAVRGELPDGSRLSGRVEFSVGNRWHTALLYTMVSREGTRLVLNREDVALIGAEYDQPLTDAEVDLVALHPLQAPILLRIKEYASRESTRLSAMNAAVPRDAFRHVLWSYLLTLEFGAGFAEEVTDAHEIGATYESGRANREMDLINNAIGRRYAREGVPESDLLRRVLADPMVVRGAESSVWPGPR